MAAHKLDRRTLLLAAALAPLSPALATMTPVFETRESLTLPSGRAMPVTIWRPGTGGPHPLIIFSHGANSTGWKYADLGRPLAAAGHLVIAPTHMDSPDHPGLGKIDPAMSMALRLEDMRGLLTLRETLGADAGPVVAAGHSYGALIAQLLVGAHVAAAGTGPDPLDAQIDCALAFSPPGPFPPNIGANTWTSIHKPMFVQTGTADLVPPIASAWEAHKIAFDTTPAPALLFVGDGVDHYFGNIIGRPERSEAPQRTPFNGAVSTALAFIAAVRAGTPLAALAAHPPAMARLAAR